MKILREKEIKVNTTLIFNAIQALLAAKNGAAFVSPFVGRLDDIVVLDADLSSSTKTSVFGKKFPERFFNMGISEQSMVTAAAGLSLAGGDPWYFGLFSI